MNDGIVTDDQIHWLYALMLPSVYPIPSQVDNNIVLNNGVCRSLDAMVASAKNDIAFNQVGLFSVSAIYNNARVFRFQNDVVAYGIPPASGL